MKKFLIVVNFLVFVFGVKAQITFTSNNVMAVGTKVYVHKDTLPSITSPGNSGANQVWNFTGVATIIYDSIRALNPSSTPYGSFFPSSNLVFIQGADYVYLKKQTTQLEAIGAYISQLNTTATFQNTDIISKFPTTYLSAYSDTSVVVGQTTGAAIGVSSVDSVKLKRTVYKKSFTDAWGQITTDVATFNSLRICDTINQIDTIWAKTSTFGWVMFSATDSLTYNYTWITDDSNYGGPIFRLVFDNLMQIKSATYYAAVPCAKPLQSSSNISFTNITGNSFKINWINGQGDDRIVVLRSGSTPLTIPQDSVEYLANAQYGDPNSAIGACYVVYNGPGNNVTVTGLNPMTQYHVAIFDYKCDPPLYRISQYPMASQFTNNNVGIESEEKNQVGFKIFPNPVKQGERLYLDKETSIEVYSILGNFITSMKNASYLDIIDFKSGIYFIKNSEGDILKFIVE
ncbi:MAG: T9SS type A sorting domain-containing protein [Bacteroidia bacterium]